MGRGDSSDPLGPIYRTPKEKAKETGGYVSVTDPGTPGVYDPSVAGRTYTGSYGGGGGGGGGYSGGGGNSAAAAAARAKAAAIAKAITDAIAKEKAAIAAAARAKFLRETSQSALRTKKAEYESQIRAGSGGVKYGGRKYTGNVIVPGTGKTANQIQQQAFEDARKKFGEGIKKGGYTATYGSKDYFSERIKEEVKTTSFKIGELPSTTSNVFSIPDSQKYGGPTRETYNVMTGVYETTPSPYGQYGQGTTNIISSRLPTPEEQRKIDILESNAATANLGNLKLDIKETSGIRERIDVLSTQIEESIKGKVNEKNEFTGTEEEFRKYENLYGKYEKASLRLQAKDRTLDFGFFTKSEKVKLSEMDAVRVGQQIGIKYWQTIPKQTGELYGDIYGDTLAKIKIGKQPEAIMDLNTGTYRLATEKDYSTLGRNIVTQEQVSKGVGSFFGLAKYAVPVVGTGAYISEKYIDINKNYGGNVGKWAKANPIEAALIGTAVVGFGIYKGGKFLKGARVSKAVTKELNVLEKTPLKSLTIYEEATGKIVARGFKKTSGGYQEVKIIGDLKKTEKGWKFIPSGKETSKIVGIATPEAKTLKLQVMENAKGQPRLDVSTGKKKLQDESELFSSGQIFEVGSKGTMIQRGSIGDLKFYENIGQTSSVPTRNIFGMVKIPESSKGVNKALRDLKGQLKKKRDLPPIEKEFKFPTGKADYVQINNLVGLKYSPKEVGVVIKIPKPIKEVGSKSEGLGSSKEFLESMYAPQKQVQEFIPKLEEISSKGVQIAKESVPKPITKTISGLPVGASTYAGTGQYERMSYEVISPKMVNVQMNNVNVGEESMIKIGTRTGSVSKTILKEKQVEESLIKPFSKETTKIVPKEAQKQRQILKELLVSKQVQKQKLEQIPKINQMLRPGLTIPRIVPKIPKILVPLFEGFKASKGKDSIDEETFKVFGRRYGKFREVAKAKSKKEAKEKAKKFSTGTLGASTFIEEGGRKIEFNLGSGFRKSKVDRFIQVQRREQRLSSFQERKEIKLSKRKKKIGWF